MQLCPVYKHPLRVPNSCSAAPFGPNVHSICGVLHSIVKAVVAVEVGKVAPGNIAAAAGRPPDEWHTQLPKVSRLAEACVRQLVRNIERLFTMQSKGFAVGGPLPGCVALKEERRAQADVRMGL